MRTLMCFFVCWAVTVRAGEEVALDPRRDPVVAAVQKALPAVVNISTERLVSQQFQDPFDDLWRQFFGRPSRPESDGAQSLGSGVIVDEDGWIVTNWHVVRRAGKIHVVMSDGARHEAQYISGDERNDLALLKIEAGKPLQCVEVSSETEPLLGETVIAVGNPFGLDHTVTKGIISARNRRYGSGDVTFEDVLQTDAAINPGNSGGPLINTRGELVGINMAILSQAEGIGFAIPARRVAGLLAAWFSPEKRNRVWLGLRFELREGRLAVSDVQPNSPAAKGGLKSGDVVMSVDGRKFPDVMRLQRHLIHKKAGELVRFELAGDRVAEVKLAALPKLSATDLMRTKFGLQVQALTEDLAEAMGLPMAQGLLVVEVEKGSPAAEAGFGRGMVITQVAGEEPQALDRLAEQLADIKTGEEVSLALLVIQRRGSLSWQQRTSVMLKAR